CGSESVKAATKELDPSRAGSNGSSSKDSTSDHHISPKLGLKLQVPPVNRSSVKDVILVEATGDKAGHSHMVTLVVGSWYSSIFLSHNEDLLKVVAFPPFSASHFGAMSYNQSTHVKHVVSRLIHKFRLKLTGWEYKAQVRPIP
ncbi:hypothetical protein HAX54_019408, partial [Datura stramonium]|nr:hypothetical protein [Datura stramonium]